MLICIDAGHYMGTPGKRCMKSIDPGETREWYLNGRVADEVQRLLADYKCKTMRVDDVTGRREVTLNKRIAAANRAKADLYLSIHHNAGIRGGAGGGIVVFVRPNADKQSKRVQQAIYRHTVARTGLRGNRSNPVPEGDLYVLNATTMPAVLGEFGFMDSTTDTPIILTEEYAHKVAAGIVAGLAEVYQLEEVNQMNYEMSYEQWKSYMERYCQELAQNPSSAWARPYIQKAIDSGLMAENGSGSIDRPMAAMSRQEAAAFGLAVLEAAARKG